MEEFKRMSEELRTNGMFKSDALVNLEKLQKHKAFRDKQIEFLNEKL